MCLAQNMQNFVKYLFSVSRNHRKYGWNGISEVLPRPAFHHYTELTAIKTFWTSVQRQLDHGNKVSVLLYCH